MSTIKKHNIYIGRFCDYITQRPDKVYRQMADYFQIGEPIPVTIIVESEGNKSINICGIPLRTGQFCGAWFTQFPFSIEANDETTTTWHMVVTHADGKESTRIYDSTVIQPDLTSCVPGDSVTFIATDTNEEDAIATNHVSNIPIVAAIYDVSGKRLPKMQTGPNIIVYANGTRRIISKQE